MIARRMSRAESYQPLSGRLPMRLDGIDRIHETCMMYRCSIIAWRRWSANRSLTIR